jgi:hypothetical protein
MVRLEKTSPRCRERFECPAGSIVLCVSRYSDCLFPERLRTLQGERETPR